MAKSKTHNGITETDVQDAIGFADAAQYLAGGRASERGRELSELVFRGSISADEAVSNRLAEIRRSGL